MIVSRGKHKTPTVCVERTFGIALLSDKVIAFGSNICVSAIHAQRNKKLDRAIRHHFVGFDIIIVESTKVDVFCFV